MALEHPRELAQGARAAGPRGLLAHGQALGDDLVGKLVQDAQTDRGLLVGAQLAERLGDARTLVRDGRRLADAVMVGLVQRWQLDAEPLRRPALHDAAADVVAVSVAGAGEEPSARP